MLTVSRQRAALYGMPHIGCEYVGSRYRMTQDYCAVCGMRATNCHHIVPRGLGETIRLETPKGTWEMRSPLIALCGTGTTGCHGRFHAGLLKARWVWDGDYEDAWWDGSLLAEIEPHDPLLYAYGRWEIDGPDGIAVHKERI